MTYTETIIARIIERQVRCDTVTSDNLADPDFLSTKEIDSLGMVELVMSIEEECSVEISDDEAEQFRPGTLGATQPLSKLAELIDAKKMERAA